MQSIASFSLTKGQHAYFIEATGFWRDNRRGYFHFDPGAGFSLMGINSFAVQDDEKQILRDVVIKAIKTSGITPYYDTMKTVTKEELTVYPCKIRDVTIGASFLQNYYFHFVIADINNPLLGFDYTDDCYYVHHSGGNIEVISVDKDAGKRFYPEKVLDFNEVLREFYLEVDRKIISK